MAPRILSTELPSIAQRGAIGLQNDPHLARRTMGRPHHNPSHQATDPPAAVAAAEAASKAADAVQKYDDRLRAVELGVQDVKSQLGIIFKLGIPGAILAAIFGFVYNSNQFTEIKSSLGEIRGRIDTYDKMIAATETAVEDDFGAAFMIMRPVPLNDGDGNIVGWCQAVHVFVPGFQERLSFSISPKSVDDLSAAQQLKDIVKSLVPVKSLPPSLTSDEQIPALLRDESFSTDLYDSALVDAITDHLLIPREAVTAYRTPLPPPTTWASLEKHMESQPLLASVCDAVIVDPDMGPDMEGAETEALPQSAFSRPRRPIRPFYRPVSITQDRLE